MKTIYRVDVGDRNLGYFNQNDVSGMILSELLKAKVVKEVKLDEHSVLYTDFTGTVVCKVTELVGGIVSLNLND